MKDGPGQGTSGRRPYRMQARQEAVDRAREAILSATYDLWLERAYDEVTLQAVAERAGVTRQTVHRHFGSKEQLVLAVVDWAGPREEAARAVPAGDVGAAIRRVIERNEEMGDANIRALELEGRVEAIATMLAQGRASHRAWIGRVFGPQLQGLRGRARDRAVMALYAATDVTVWKLLRRDFGLSVPETERIVSQLVEGVLDRTTGGMARGGQP